MEIPASEAEECLDELIDRALAGEEIILTLEGRPVAKLRPVDREGNPIS
jgi:prevent-host-death family protein